METKSSEMLVRFISVEPHGNSLMLISLFGNFVFISEIPEHEARSFMVKPELDSQNMKSEAKAEDDIMSIYLGGK